ncbi:MAG: hypothetical protein FRX49_04592 [Trebouxia sp. A1-2]|nr:MAG: hypothetical protein FRX49_04592 [Trebouxia sp. A1-2]
MASCDAIPPMTAATQCSSPAPKRHNSPTKSSDIEAGPELLSCTMDVAMCFRAARAWRRASLLQLVPVNSSSSVLYLTTLQEPMFLDKQYASADIFDHAMVNDGERSDASQYKILKGFGASWRTVKQAYPGALQG